MPCRLFRAARVVFREKRGAAFCVAREDRSVLTPHGYVSCSSRPCPFIECCCSLFVWLLSHVHSRIRHESFLFFSCAGPLTKISTRARELTARFRHCLRVPRFFFFLLVRSILTLLTRLFSKKVVQDLPISFFNVKI